MYGCLQCHVSFDAKRIFRQLVILFVEVSVMEKDALFSI